MSCDGTSPSSWQSLKPQCILHTPRLLYSMMPPGFLASCSALCHPFNDFLFYFHIRGPPKSISEHKRQTRTWPSLCLDPVRHSKALVCDCFPPASCSPPRCPSPSRRSSSCLVWEIQHCVTHLWLISSDNLITTTVTHTTPSFPLTHWLCIPSKLITAEGFV